MAEEKDKEEQQHPPSGSRVPPSGSQPSRQGQVSQSSGGAQEPLPHSGASGSSDDDELMKIRKAAGAIAEVIEPVQRTRLERTG